MKITTQRDLIRSVAERWRRQCGLLNDDPPLFSVRNGHQKPSPLNEVAEKLAALDVETATTEDVTAIIGNKLWTRLTCNECGEDVDAVLTVGEEPDRESRTASLCRSCLEKAASKWQKVYDYHA